MPIDQPHSQFTGQLRNKVGDPFILGVNYWPRRKAMYFWSNFDREEVHEEFSLIRELGMTVVRIFLFWDDFQPDPSGVNQTAIDNLVEVCDIADSLGLKLDVTFFTGHMSGPNWPPRWLVDPSLPRGERFVAVNGKNIPYGYRNPFTDPQAIAAQKLLLQTVVTTLKDHPAVWLWNLGNEPDIFAKPESSEAGQAWTRGMIAVIRGIDPAHPITYGLHMDDLQRDLGLRVDKIYAETDIAVMHSYPMYTDWARHPLDPDLVPFSCALTAALSGKQTLMEEFGGCTALPGQESYTMKWTFEGKYREQFMASESDLATYLEQVLPNLQHSGATGAMVWCFADYATELWDRPPLESAEHERFFGLVRPDGSLKPHAEVIKRFAATQPTIQPIPDYARIDGLNPDQFYTDAISQLPSLYADYLRRKGETP